LFDHVTIRVADRARSRDFYETVLAPLERALTHAGAGFDEWNDFSIGQASDARPATRGLHLAFGTRSRDEVDAFWRAGTRAGYPRDGGPGLRAQYHPDYYGAFLLDPDGNSIEAVHYGDLRRGGIVDHVWVRVADLDTSRRFYEAIAPAARLRITRAQPDRVTLAGESGSFSLVPGEPTEHLHVAFGTDDDAAVTAFHAAATAAGAQSNGAPGERPQYHRGYYAAYVLDPDGNNVELVNHHR
jgi:catechol 2,3-dioxygenase-like lactoylglutathione lyase family enzyme